MPIDSTSVTRSCGKAIFSGRPGHAAAAADVDQPQRLVGAQAVEQGHRRRERIEKVARFDFGRVGNARQIDAPIAFAQRGAQLVEPGQLGIAELDFEASGALNQIAHAEVPKPGRIIRII